ncbi:MAG: hypothetical protein LUM44_24690, partial [Pyrinomonadaceae bacterium]|nr:hypothetical protein [Pyrinomonadaceae bacterium]
MSKKETSEKSYESTHSTETASAESRNGILGKLKHRWWLVAVIGVLSLGVLGSTLKYLDDD